MQGAMDDDSAPAPTHEPEAEAYGPGDDRRPW